MKCSLIKLINEFANETQKREIRLLKKNFKDKHIVNYMTLFHLLDSQGIVTKEEVKIMFNIDDIKLLTTVDFIIARVIKTLTQKTGRDIAKGYESALVLDNTQPELEYLIRETRKCLISETQLA